MRGRVSRPGTVRSDPERPERQRACLQGLSARKQRSCMFVCLIALQPVADAMSQSAVGEGVRVSASGDWYELVDFSAHRMRSLQRLVDRLATDGAHVIGGQHPCPELSAPLAVADALVAPLAHVASHVYGAQGVMDLSMIIFAVGLLECRYRGSRIWTLPCLVGAPHHL